MITSSNQKSMSSPADSSFDQQKVREDSSEIMQEEDGWLKDISPKLLESLQKIHQWYYGMICIEKQSLYYEFKPLSHIYVEEKVPIRNIGNVWDLIELNRHLKKKDYIIDNLMQHSISQFCSWLSKVKRAPIPWLFQYREMQKKPSVSTSLEPTNEPQGVDETDKNSIGVQGEKRVNRGQNVNDQDEWKIFTIREFNTDHLEEPAHIGHNAMFILCLVGYCKKLKEDDEEMTIICEEEKKSRYATMDEEKRKEFEQFDLKKDGETLEQTTPGCSQLINYYYELIHQLCRGILYQQRIEDGSYKVYFSKTIESDYGMEFYASEAMLALMHASELLLEPAYMESVRKALPFYKKHFTSHQVPSRETVFFANWQTQAFSMLHRLYKGKNQENTRKSTQEYIFQMQDSIINKRKFFNKLKESPEEYATVEVACALEGLSDGYGLMLDLEKSSPHGISSDRSWSYRKKSYSQAMKIAIDFLLRIQKECVHLTKGGPGSGGFGHALGHHIQRLDVTGHVLSAFIKILKFSQNKVK